jgi:predicted  nucleic acid-binding Zn-ribbon protein
MGPTNVALVKLYKADQALREAQARLDAATRGVRVQERKVNELGERLAVAKQKLMEAQAKNGQLELDIKSRDARIEKLRTQQTNAKNNKEYQAFLIEINTEKVDKNKVEEELLKVMESVEQLQNEVKDLTAQQAAEQQKLEEMRNQIGDTTAAIQAEVDALRPRREEAAAAVPPKAREVFERLANHHEGEAMAAISKPDRRREEYSCTACMMDLVTDVYYKLHSRDELIFCPSCRRILYIPDDLPVETAVHKRGSTRKKSSSSRSAPSLAAAAPRQESAIDVLTSMTSDEDEDAPETPENPSANQG